MQTLLLLHCWNFPSFFTRQRKDVRGMESKRNNTGLIFLLLNADSYLLSNTPFAWLVTSLSLLLRRSQMVMRSTVSDPFSPACNDGPEAANKKQEAIKPKSQKKKTKKKTPTVYGHLFVVLRMCSQQDELPCTAEGSRSVR